MWPADDDEVPARLGEQVDAATGAIEQRFLVDEGTELLGPEVADDLRCQGPETDPVAASQDERPRGCGRCTHDPSLPPVV